MAPRAVCDASALVALLLDGGRDGRIDPDQAVQTHADLLHLAIERWPYELLAGRAWELRAALPIHDGCYAALTELAEARSFTLDRRLGRTPGLRCRVVTPEA